VVNLACVDQVIFLAAAEIDAIPVIAVECKAGDGQRPALGAGRLDPGARARRDSCCRSPWRRRPRARPSGGREHLLAVDLKAFAELEVGPVDDHLQMLLALDQWLFSEIISVR